MSFGYTRQRREHDRQSECAAMNGQNIYLWAVGSRSCVPEFTPIQPSNYDEDRIQQVSPLPPTRGARTTSKRERPAVNNATRLLEYGRERLSG